MGNQLFRGLSKLREGYKIGRGNTYTKDLLIQLLQTYKEHAYSISSWEKFRKESKDLTLPHSQTFIKVFSSWNSAKEAASLETQSQSRPSEYSRHQLISILEKHGQHFTSMSAWDEFAKENEWPVASTILRHLNDSDKAKYLPKNIWRSNLTKSELKQILKKHFPETPPTAKDWENYRKVSEVSLPSQTLFISRFGNWNNTLSETYAGRTNRGSGRRYTKEELQFYMKKYFPYHQPTAKEWTDMKKSVEDELPSIGPYTKQYGSWNKALQAIYMSDEL